MSVASEPAWMYSGLVEIAQSIKAQWDSGDVGLLRMRKSKDVWKRLSMLDKFYLAPAWACPGIGNRE